MWEGTGVLFLLSAYGSMKMDPLWALSSHEGFATQNTHELSTAPTPT